MIHFFTGHKFEFLFKGQPYLNIGLANMAFYYDFPDLSHC